MQIKTNAESLHQIKTRSGRARMQLVLPPLKGKQQHRDRAKILEGYSKIRSNDNSLNLFLKKFIHGSPSTGMEVKLGTTSEVNAYIKLLRKLGVPKSRIILWFYPDPRSLDESQNMVKRWTQDTGIPAKRILVKPSAKSQLSQNPRKKIGWISVFVCEDKNSLQKSSGIQQALHLLSVFKGSHIF